MYSIEEAKLIRKEYWDKFKSWSGRKRTMEGKKGEWLMNDTGIKQMKLKFHFDETIALVAIEIDTRNPEKRIELWNKLESLKNKIEEEIPFPLVWDIDYPLSETKSVSRIYTQITGISIYKKKCWGKANNFFYKKMNSLEDFFLKYKDYIKYSKT
jgi:hypothetical protein